jgi:hypothetical protein
MVAPYQFVMIVGRFRDSGTFAHWNQSPQYTPTPTGFAEFVGNDFPVLHARRIPARLRYHG